MQAYFLRRIASLLPTLLIASLIVFVSIRLIPGNVIDLMLSNNDIAADTKSREQIVAALGLDKPMWQQYLNWVKGIVLHGNLGESLWQSVPVTELIAERLPITLELGLIALIVSLTMALPIGIYSAIRQDTAGDYISRSIAILPRWPVQIPPPVATPNSPRQDRLNYDDSVPMAMRAAASLSR